MYKQLKNMVELVGGYSFKSEKYVTNGIRVVRIANVQDGFFSDEYPCFYDMKTISELGKANLEDGDLLMSLTGNIGRVAFVPKEMLPAGLNQRVECFRTSNTLLKRYLFYFFRTSNFLNEANRNSTGVAQQNMSTKWLGNVLIPITTEYEMEHIVKTLTSIDEQIINTRNDIHRLDELIKSRFIEMFSQTYKTKKWSEVVKIINGEDYKKIPNIKGTYPIYGSGGYMQMRCDEYLTKENSVIIGRKGNVTNPLFIKEKYWNVDTAFGIEPGPELDPLYFYYFSLTINLEDMVTGATIPSLTKTQLLNLMINIPPIELQNEFASFVKQVDKLKFI